MKKLIFILCLFCLTNLGAGTAGAATIGDGTFFVGTSFGAPGDTASVQLGYTFDPNIIGAFSLDILFDENVLAFQSVDFTNVLGVPDADQSLGIAPPFETDIFVTPSPGQVHLEELSLLFSEELFNLQFNQVFIATLNFTIQQSAPLNTFSEILISDLVLSDADGFQLDPEILNGGVFVVPEPSTLLLLGFGLAGLAVWRKRKE
jgi:hypothetical protein